MHIFKSQSKGIFFEIAVSEKNNSTLLILLPGLPEYPRPKKLMQELASEGYIVMYLRYKGTFESDGDFLSRSPAEDISELIDNLKNEKKIIEFYNNEEIPLSFDKVVTVSTSFGGSIALHLNKLSKEITTSLVFCPVLDFKSHNTTYKEQDLINLGSFIERAFPNIYRFKPNNYKKLLKGKIIPSAFEKTEEYNGKIIIVHNKDDLVVSIENTKKFAKELDFHFVEQEKGGHISLSKLNKETILDFLE